MDKRWYERVIWLSLLLIVIVIMVGKASLDKQTGHQATNSITQTILDQKRVLADADEHVKTCKEAVHVCDDALRDCKHELIRAMSADPSAPATTQPSRTAKRVKHKR